jgi:5-methylcytosine-specific restriction endonuclease McrA
MPDRLEQSVRHSALGRCEYCRMPESASRLAHVLDHIIARQHGGKTEFNNLALCCGRCNQFKGPNIAGIDSGSGQMMRLFNPRLDNWTDHFHYQSATLIGLTPIGRATVAVLAINIPIRVAARRAIMELGVTF